MIFADLYHNSTGWNGKDFSGPIVLTRMCGSDSMIHLDARKTLANQQSDVENRIKSLNQSLGLGVKGYQIMRGASLLTARPLTPVRAI